MNFQDLLYLSAQCAKEAGQIIVQISTEDDINVISKGIAGPVTRADKTVERMIVSTFNKYFPNLSIVGEEDEEPHDEYALAYSKPPASHPFKDCPLYDIDDIIAYIDPLDGTRDFVATVDDSTSDYRKNVTTLIGFTLKSTKQCVAGVVHFPFSEPNGHSVIGIVETKQVFGLQSSSMPNPNTVIYTQWAPYNTISEMDMYGSMLNIINSTMDIKQVFRAGGMGSKAVFALNAGGIYVDCGTGSKRWDSCAPEAIVRAAGGHVCDIVGDSIVYDPSLPIRNETGVVFFHPLAFEKHSALVDGRLMAVLEHVMDSWKK
ncbi:hypothetical protein PCE1_000231 [Barthelona sp. PCE]